MRNAHLYIYILIITLCSSCSVNKFIPEDKYLLDEVTVVSDTKELKASQFIFYIRQNPNARWFSMLKVPMRTYCLSGLDSTKWINRFFRKIGDAPVIYDESVALKSQQEIEKAVRNMGYMGATVHLQKTIKKKKLKLAYNIQAGHPYVVSHVAYDIDDMLIHDYIQQDSTQSLLRIGMPFDVNVLDAERQRITKLLLDNGYYKFNKDFLVYQADTVRNTYKVDLTMRLLPYQRKREDTPQRHEQYKVRNVYFLADNEIMSLQGERQLDDFDSLQYKGYSMYYKDKVFLRPKILLDFNRIRLGELYSAQDVQNTYSNLSRLRAMKYSNIRFLEVTEDDSTQLDAYVMLAKNKNKSVSFEVEGTNSAGDLGAAAAISFQHLNVFKGSELFTFKVRGAYEAITGLGSSSQDYVNDNYVEYGIESSLNFPEFMFPFLSSDFKKKIKATSEVGLKFTSQVRPEFSRMLASASWSYKWNDRRRIQHCFNLIDINYVYMPRMSESFQEYLDQMTQRNSLLKTSYEDQLIISMGYSFTYNSAGSSIMRTPTQNSYSIRVNFEEAGNFMYAVSKLFHSSPKDDNYLIANTSFAQYVKADFDFAKNYIIDQRNSFVFHIGMGIAYPYGNKKMLPFEKRYFSGGANSVRGWPVRSLGPGVYKGSEDGNMDYINQAGDIKLDLNVEYRTHLFWKLNGAAFADAGNIWTIRDDSEQEGGLFKFNKFYKQIAVAYGLGIRFDLDYLILRFDGGMKAVNPVESGNDRFPITHPRLSRDFAFHFAVGYPF